MPELQIPRAFTPLLAPSRYKVMYGGRGSAKSWSVARALLHLATLDPLRILCCREVMRTLADSVHRLLSDQVEAMGLSDWYTVQDASITGRNGAEFLYAGLRTLDAGKIKSYEGVDIAWVEEGQMVSKRSRDILIPTIRADESEIWETFNPELDSDDAWLRYVVDPPDGAWVQKVSYLDNPWFPKVLEDERLSLLKRDPESYRNVWEGECRTVVEGAIYAREVLQMMEAHRIRPVPYNPKIPVHTIWDLGWNDQTSIIFVQRVLSEVCIIDYDEESFLRFDEWAKRLKEKPYNYGEHWLPHDGASELQAANGASAQKILKPLLGKNPKIIKRASNKEVPIKAARMMFPRVYMDVDKTKRLQLCLKRYRRGIPESTGEPGHPIHDEFSHGADAFGGLATIVDELRNEPGSTMPRLETHKPAVEGVM